MYSSQTDIINLELTEAELIALTDDAKAGSVDSTKVTAAVSKADAEINSYCQGRYTIPFSPVPEEIKFLSATMAAYWLFRRRQKVSESMLDKYIKATARLKDIADGHYTIQAATLKTDSVAIGCTIDDTSVPTFTRTKKDINGAVVGDKGSMDIW